MRKSLLSLGAVLAFTMSGLQPAKAQTPVNVIIGSQPPSPFNDGTKQTVGAYNTAVAGQPMPFNAFCGSDTASNCSATWTFSYVVPVGDTITSAIFTLGIYDIDSAATGTQVFSFTLNGSDDLRSLLNAASEGLNGGTGSLNSYYNVLTITVPEGDFVDLDGGAATFALALQGPGLGVLGNTTHNGAGLVFSSLDMEATGPVAPIPEIPSWMLFLTGVLLVGIKPIWGKLARSLNRTTSKPSNFELPSANVLIGTAAYTGPIGLGDRYRVHLRHSIP